jgi:tetratricopeptide (TPR) repeat protein
VLVAKPENRAAQAALGTLFERTGRYTKALQILHPLIEANLQDANAIVAWATACRRLGQSERAIPNLQRFLEGPRAQPEKVLLIHTLGDLYDNCGQHKEAFEAHKTANQLHGLSFDPERFSRSIDQIIEAFPASSFGRRSRASRTDSSPVLIVGMPRSGTSLVEQIIDSHAQAAGAGELETLRQISGVLSRNAGKVDWNTSMDSMDSALADKLSEAYLSKLRETDSTAIRITDKMPINFLNLGMAAQILPGARVIHCTRDPLDTALSCYFKLFNFGYAFSTRLSWLGHFTLGYLRLMAHWDQVLPLPTLQVRYESLVEDLDTGARRIVDFLDLPWDENCLRFHENTRQVNTASYAQVRRPIYRSSLGRAQDYLEWLGPLRDVLDR